ncbi:BTAD domain-containing putative transcriptional regulator [Candidatus Nitrospira nitrificans]|uniref:Putative Transcriptional activator domain n=1 Tax=Candidatus Nitrospira nitrificans TaxID=1742973 RepID=A0A0S4LMV7_9BACT|nr:BTAD domain-containing putative transcriptional regulator [Candidatus Nitrospira nitrificans]CUS38270.1 putative Transcriptional activator domain [Candidatus Nitrospira nitrificans]
MPGRTAALAKLTPPRLYAVTPRERLFTLVKERCRHHPLIWVAGPPGAGKTSLVASYLAAHKQRALWYHVDPGDADLATFFHYLALAAQAAAGRRRLRLPALTPEFMADVPGFTRRFMRELWSKVPLPAVLVLDNYQEVPVGAALHSILPIALAEFPEGAALISISRGEAPEPFVRELVHNGVGHIRWEDLRLTFEETASLARSVSDIDEEALRSLHARANGWVAGTILLLERIKVNESLSMPAPPETKTEVFHYFAKQVFMGMDSRTREVLMRTALLPWVTGPMAEEVSGNPDAARIVRDLYERGLFVDRRADAQVRYQYHDLFREFLLYQGRAHFDAEALQSITHTAAQVAERHGQQDTAVALYAETQSWDDLSRLICEIAEKLLQQGRNQTLQRYISLFPHDEQEQRPWLLYWSGISRLVFDPITARTDLETAYHLFKATGGDVTGLLLTCSGIIEAYYCRADDMAPAIIWGDRLHKILQQHNGFPSSATKVNVLANLQGLIFACPHHQLLEELDQSLDQILNEIEDPAARVGVATTFMNLMLWRGEFPRLRQTLGSLTTRNKGVILSPVYLLTWKAMEAHYAWGTGHPAQATAKLEEALGIAERHGLLVFRTLVRACQACNASVVGDNQGVERFADLLEEENHFNQQFSLGLCSHYRAAASLMRGDFSSALDFALSAVEKISSLCLPYFAGYVHSGMAKVLIGLSEMEKAREHLGTVIDYARVIRSPWMRAECHMTFAHSHLLDGQFDLVNEHLRKGLGIACRHDYLVLDFWWRPKVMADLLTHALEADIEIEYVRSVIRRRNLRAPSAGVKHWPYPVRITTLGKFEVAIDDVSLTTTGKTQRKPLELLKYLCAAGPSGANQELIEEALWPEADGEAADQAFRTTLHRLQKLLRHDDAVQLSDRHVSLDPSLVSLDHVAFERLAHDVDRADTIAIERVLSFYHGHFLQGETASWALPVRERLRAQFLDLTERLGALLEERGQVGDAAQKYLHALEVEPVAEVMCRRVMMTYVRLGRRSEAIGVYQRFSQALHTKLGVPPTPETVSLYYTISKT